LLGYVASVAATDGDISGKELHFALRNDVVVPASQMSDGIVLATALAVISLGTGTQRLLIEEPENGLHPRQLKGCC
jgi:predicted ATPase